MYTFFLVPPSLGLFRFLYHARNSADDDAVLWRCCCLSRTRSHCLLAQFQFQTLTICFWRKNLSAIFTLFFVLFLDCSLHSSKKIFNALLTWWFFISALYVKTTEAITQQERQREREREGETRKMRCTLKRNVEKYFFRPARKLTAQDKG